ncbi:MAG: hypothetical protein NPINA01_08120 [Nitrospinaceae bacterium]|nr:MAG: hypothetical protein NPINA01_08120 [Nitrospinaceae bacterium]
MQMTTQPLVKIMGQLKLAARLLIGFFLIGPSGTVYGQDLGVSVSPKRVVFEGRQRTTEVTLLNKSNKTVTYRVFFRNMRMKEDGSFEKVEEAMSGEKFSDQLIRYSPRQITVPPRGSQSVRLLLRKPRKLPPGEYRSHLFFQSLPSRDTGKSIDDELVGKNELKIKLVAILSLSIPVIVRNGKLEADVGLSNLDLKAPETKNTPSVLSANLNRKGERSIFGDVQVIFKPVKGRHFTLAELRGLSVYTPNKTRKLEMPLRIPEGEQLKNGSLYVVYKETKDAGGAILAKAKLPVP